MPLGQGAVSGKQYRLMAMIHGGGKPKAGGPSPEVAAKFVEETSPEKRSRWSHRRLERVRPMRRG